MSPRPPHRFYFAGHIAGSIDAAHGAAVLELPANESHHLLNVLRLRPGTQIDVFDAAGNAWSAELLAGEGKEIARVRLLSAIQPENDSGSVVNLAVCLLKRRAMDWLLEKLSEMGVETLQPLVSARTVVHGADREGEHPERWDRLVLAAAKQCGRNRPLGILPSAKIGDWLSRPRPPAHTAFAAFGPGAQTLGDWLREREEIALPRWVVIGPEGGWTAEEHDAFALAAFRPVSLGSLTLRAETAALAAAAACRLV